MIISGATAAVLALGAFALVNGDGKGTAKSAQAAQTAPRATAPPADRPRSEPPRASRGKPRSPEPSPTKTKTSKRGSDTQAGHVPEAEKKQQKKKRNKVVESGSCEASYYWQGQMTASGEPFDPSELTAAHKTLPMGSKVRVTNKNNDRSVTVRINDRGPYAGGRCLDLSRAAMKKVGGTGAGVIPVRYEVLSRG
ncbi:septal ring lytic transglycosylase RlpA family protein [Spirillospora sp. NPDC048819]|uniref:septal ring lytic transglycosylase RlpA family protein n=1 Tax=Spirillospora sp. NPDC048819 TaxID=3155268 RepID=UPI00340F1D87